MKKMSKMVLGFIGGLALTLNTAFIVNADWKAENGGLLQVMDILLVGII